MSENSDILENDIVKLDESLMPLLLVDRTRTTDEVTHHIIWATDNYVSRGGGYQEWDEISVAAVTGKHGRVLRPRVNKSKAEQEHRSRDKAEVFTPVWICNKQNNLIDGAWFGTGVSPFNTEKDEDGSHIWVTSEVPIPFPTKDGKTWQDYVKDTRLEMACGEAPYLVSRYGVVTGIDIPVPERIGILDRKLRVVNENTSDKREWMRWVTEAYKSTYGFEWQGDNLVLARESMVFDFIDYYFLRWGEKPTKEQTRKITEIVSWNLWQMDGIKAVIPGSCYDEKTKEYLLFGEVIEHVEPCEGCESDDIRKHNGIYCRIMDWEAKKAVRFVDLIKN